ncbi:4-galactosyl-N-acetylglucosaminide 3-alpha-L-fucosyltransferase 9-like isoform X2 [Convolutriloba macropyga]
MNEFGIQDPVFNVDPTIHQKLPASKEQVPWKKDISVLYFDYGLRNLRKNFKSACNLEFDCTLTYDAYPDNLVPKMTSYDSIIVVGGPGSRRFLSFWSRTSKTRIPSQIWTAISLESSRHPDIRISRGHLGDMFNWTGGLSRRANLERSYVYFYKNPEQLSMTQVKANWGSWSKRKSFCWMVSNCVTYRKKIMSELVGYLDEPLHMWGTAARSCMEKSAQSNIINHGSMPLSDGRHFGDEYRQDIIKECKVYFAFENSLCLDYVTEKFSNAIMTHTIPVVTGFKSSYERKMPGSFIHVNDFQNLSSLGAHLNELVKDEDKLLNYHSWRQNFYSSVGESLDEPECQICWKIANSRVNRETSIIPDINRAFYHLEECEPM